MAYFKGLFSNRKGLQKVSSALLKDEMTEDLTNAINNCFIELWDNFKEMDRIFGSQNYAFEIEKELWIHFLNYSISDFGSYHSYSHTSLFIVNSKDTEWFTKLDLIEYTIKYIEALGFNNPKYSEALKLANKKFIVSLNYEFERLDYVYRVVDNKIVEVTSAQEIECIEDALNYSKDNIHEHLDKALELYAKKPEPDLRNSIKESISAVEAVCREIAGCNDLGAALKQLEKKGITIHPKLQNSMEHLYRYTNDKNTGIRHALLEEDNGNAPTKAETYYLLITCSAFINYLRMKIAN